MSIMSTPFKHPRTNVYYFRMAVPKSLVPIIGKTEFKTSLRTKNLSEAKRLYGEHLKSAHEQIELAKLKLAGGSGTVLKRMDCAILAERWFERVRAELSESEDYGSYLQYETYWNELVKLEQLHSFGLTDAFCFHGVDLEKATEEEFLEVKEGLQAYIESQLDIEKLIIDPHSDSYRYLVVAFYDYVRKIEAWCKACHKREYGYEPISSPIAGRKLSAINSVEKQFPIGSGNSISKVYEQYAESSKINGKSTQYINETQLHINRLIELIGDIPIEQVSKKHLVRFRDTLLQLPKTKAVNVRSMPLAAQIEYADSRNLPRLNATSVKNCLRKTSAMFGHAIEIGLIDINPHVGVKVSIPQDKSQIAEDSESPLIS